MFECLSVLATLGRRFKLHNHFLSVSPSLSIIPFGNMNCRLRLLRRPRVNSLLQKLKCFSVMSRVSRSPSPPGPVGFTVLQKINEQGHARFDAAASFEDDCGIVKVCFELRFTGLSGTLTRSTPAQLADLRNNNRKQVLCGFVAFC